MSGGLSAPDNVRSDTEINVLAQAIHDASPIDYLLYTHYTVSAHGGTLTPGSWLTRPLNTEDIDTGGHGSLASNQITLVAGTYEFFACAQGYAVSAHQLRLYNATDAAVIAYGVQARAIAEPYGTNAMVQGRFTIAASKAIELQHRGGAHSVTVGMGNNNFFGNNIFASVALRKVA